MLFSVAHVTSAGTVGPQTQETGESVDAPGNRRAAQTASAPLPRHGALAARIVPAGTQDPRTAVHQAGVHDWRVALLALHYWCFRCCSCSMRFVVFGKLTG